MHLLGRNNLIGYCLTASSKHDVRMDHLFAHTPTIITSSDNNKNMAIADSQGNSVSLNCHSLGEVAIAMDGRLANQDQLYQQILSNNMVLLNKSSEELVAYLLAEGATQEKSVPLLIKQFLAKYPGGYSLIIMNKGRIYAARDCYGIKSLVIGQLEESQDVIEYDFENEQPKVTNKMPNLIASNSIILEKLEAKYIRQILPGEIVELSTGGVKSVGICYRESGDSSSFCSMEYVMLESPFSSLEEQRVYDVRYRLGELLGLENDVKCDCAVTLPDVSLAFVLGFAQTSAIDIVEAFCYSVSATGPKHLSLYNDNICGKVVALVVDSTLNHDLTAALSLLANSSAKAVHLRICSPKIVSSCPFGINVSVDSRNVQQVASIVYLKVDSFSDIIRRKIPENEVKNVGHCLACVGKGHKILTF